MKVGTLRFVVVAVITGLLLVAGSTTAWAQSPNYSPDFSANQNLMNLNGNGNGLPAFVRQRIPATRCCGSRPTQGNRVGSAWFNVQQPVKNGFTTTFTFQITGGAGSPTSGDGIAFVIQNATAGVGAIGYTGGNGGALGTETATDTDPSQARVLRTVLAIEFDTYDNEPWDQASAQPRRHSELRSRTEYIAPSLSSARVQRSPIQLSVFSHCQMVPPSRMVNHTR